MSARRARLLGALLVAATLAACGGSSSPPDAPDTTATASATPEPLGTVAGVDLATEQFDGIEQHGNVLGDPDAKVTLVEYADLVCTPCAVYSQDVLPQVIEDHVRSGDVRIELRPIGIAQEWSTLAAQYAWGAAAQDRMWTFAKLWWANQRDETTDYVDDAFARRIAEAVPGLDPDQLVDDSRLAETRAQHDDAAQAFLTQQLDRVPAFAAGPTGGELEVLDLGETGAQASRALDHVIAAF
ncbi:DsbA family protein [Solirubrobacter phytolaccae]|uniref:DsbA family protein n=1 Tax=Solirubrobacter phytolaccae TaxID=1404360 RepID=A0A9X3N8D9_9ACTN|nr:thioredoxin domain-containing protein [Solirubrobacter phytolaccae]MDA0180324.1 DsbA family protein [Solirubrobacter phytolaccae]